MNVFLSKSELERYNRQIIMPEWGEEGQKKLKSSRVIITGVGGLGCSSSLYLAVAGIGELIIIDNEKFELSNLNRQILGWTKDIGRPKVNAVTEKLKEINPEISIKPKFVTITKENIGELIDKSNVVIDALDNWHTRFLVNEACVHKKIPYIHAGVYGFIGQITTIIPGKTPCLQCIMPDMPAEISKPPIVGVTPALLATLQVMETIKLIVGIGKTLEKKILIINGENFNFTTIDLKRAKNCPVCSYLWS